MARKDIMRREANNRGAVAARSYYERRIVPPADIIESDHDYTVRIDMPGVEESSIDIKIEGNKLRIRGSTGEYVREGARMLVNELRPTVYEREFLLGKGINRDAIKAEYVNGVLFMTLEKSEDLKPREIKIK